MEQRQFNPSDLSDFFTPDELTFFLSVLQTVKAQGGYGEVRLVFSNGRIRFMHRESKFDLLNPASWPTHLC